MKIINILILQIQAWGWHEWLVCIFILAAVFTRLWNLPLSMQFQGDQGRDAFLVSQIFKDFNPVLIGPVTSVGNMYLGPFYYYFMLPFLWLSYPSPVGPAYGVAFIAIFTVWLMYYLGRDLVGQRAATLATFLATFSSTLIVHSRFSWNPNLAPLLSLLLVISVYRAWTKDHKYWLGAAFLFSLLIQLHYLTLLAGFGAGLVWLFQLMSFRKNIKKLMSLFKVTLGGVLIFVGSLIPQFLFDWRHGWINTKAFENLLFGESNFYSNAQDLGQKIIQPIYETHGRSMHILFEVFIGQERTLNTLLLVIFFITFFSILLIKNKAEIKHGLWVLMAFLSTGIIGVSFYQNSVFDHYILYLFPITFLLLGAVLDFWMKQKYFGKIFVSLFLALFISWNVSRLPLQNSGWTIEDMKRTAETILDRVEPGEAYNIVLISESGDLFGQNYRYFLDTHPDKRPLKTEKTVEADVIFVINEQRIPYEIIYSDIYELVVFPDKEPVEVYRIEGGPEISVLRRFIEEGV